MLSRAVTSIVTLDKHDYRTGAPWPPEGPLNLEKLVPGGGEIELDIGFGRGMSVFERARVAPEARLIGIEIKTKWASKVDARCRRLGLDRVRIFCGDAREICARAEPPGCVARVAVHFPDPWWKKRHQKRMVVCKPFLEDLARLLRPSGELLIQTDVPERAEQYRELLDADRCFERVSLIDGENNPFFAPSNRERRAIEDGLPIYRILAVRS